MRTGESFVLSGVLAAIIEESGADEIYLLAALHRRALDVAHIGEDGKVALDTSTALLIPEHADLPFDGIVSITGHRVDVTLATFESAMGEASLGPFRATQAITLQTRLPATVALGMTGRGVERCLGRTILGEGRIRAEAVEHLPNGTRIILEPTPPTWRTWPEPLPEGSGNSIQIEEGKRR